MQGRIQQLARRERQYLLRGLLAGTACKPTEEVAELPEQSVLRVLALTGDVLQIPVCTTVYVADLRQQACARAGIPHCELFLSGGEDPLEDGHAISELGITSASSLFMVPKELPLQLDCVGEIDKTLGFVADDPSWAEQQRDWPAVRAKVHDDSERVVMRLRAKVYASVVPTYQRESGVLAQISTAGLPCASEAAGGTGCIGWRGRGVGELRFLRHRHTGRTRVVMREEKTLVVRLNFAVALAPGMLRRSPTCDRTVFVTACDFSSGVGLGSTRGLGLGWPSTHVYPQNAPKARDTVAVMSGEHRGRTGQLLSIWDEWGVVQLEPASSYGKKVVVAMTALSKWKEGSCMDDLPSRADYAGRQIYAVKCASQMEMEGFCRAFAEASTWLSVAVVSE
jgi:hypothetical protein